MQNALYSNVNYLIHKLITYVKTFVQFMSEQMLLTMLIVIWDCQRRRGFAI